MHWRASLAGQAPAPGEDGPDLLLGAQPGDPVLPGGDAAGGEFVSDEPVPERQIIAMDIEGGVDQVRVVSVPLRHRIALPGIEGLPGEAGHPAGHHDGNTIGGKAGDQRAAHFGEISRAKYAAARRRISFSCSSARFRFFSSRNSADSLLVTPGQIPSPTPASFSQRCRHDSQIPKSFGDLRQRGITLPGHRDHIPAELQRETPSA
jgi:hypothetical protein